MPVNRKRRFSPFIALAFQAGVALIALMPILAFDLPVATQGLGVGQYLLLGTAGGVLTYGLLLWLSRMDWLSVESLQKHVRDLHWFALSQSWPVLIGLALLAGLGEELLFRGLIQGWATEYVGVTGGILAGALLFGLAHALSIAYCLIAIALGAVFGVIYAVSESIQLVMVWHAVYDLAVLVALRQFPELLGLDSANTWTRH